MGAQLGLTVVIGALVVVGVFVWYFRTLTRLQPKSESVSVTSPLNDATAPALPDPTQAAELAGIRPLILEAVIDQLRSENVQPEQRGTKIRLGAGDLAISFELVLYNQYQDAVVSTLEFKVEFDPQGVLGVISTQVGGVGRSVPESFANGAREWVKGFTSPLRDSVRGADSRYQLAVGIPGETGPREGFWKIYPGPLQILGTQDDSKRLHELLEKTPPIKLVLNDIGNELVPGRMNWLKIYVGINDRKQIFGECNLNNSNWRQGFDAIADHIEKAKGPGSPEWFQPASGFVTFRQFIVFKPTTDVADKLKQELASRM